MKANTTTYPRRERQVIGADSGTARGNLADKLLLLMDNSISKLQLLRREWKLIITLFRVPLHRHKFKVILLLQGLF